MKTKLFKSMNLIRRGSGASLNLFRYTAMVIMLLTLGVGNAWGSATYKLRLKTVTQNNTGYGIVYAGETNATPEYSSYYTSKDPAYDAVTASSKEYYLWAVPTQRGVVFNNWTTSSTSSGSCTAGSSTLTDANKMQGAKVKVNAPTNASGTDTYTTTATVTANWKNQYSKVAVTYATPVDGKYRVTYEYSYLNTSTNALETGFTFDMDGSSAARSEDSYNNDVITLQSLDGIFEGWYSGSTLLSKNNPYTYVAPAAGGSVTISAHYTHVDKYYGKLTASIAEVPYSMPGGGTIFIANDPDVSGTYSADAQSVSNETYGESQNYYLHAQPNDKRYVFRGWYSDAACTSLISTNADYAYTFTSSSTNSASPTLGNVYAAFDFNLYYMQVEVEPAVPGLGMVFVKDDNSTTPVYTEYTTHSEQFLYAYRLAPTANAYLYAKPKYGYKFSGWYDNPDCTGTAKSTANPYTFAATGTSTDPMNPTITKLYAKFIEDATTVNITYNKPDQTKGEYTASVLDIAEVDDDFIWTFTQVFTSEGKTGNTTQAQHKTDVLRLEAQPKAGYGVTSWTIAGAAKTTPSQLYETTGTADATYGVTFGDAKPFLVSTNSTQYATLREALTAVGNSGQITVVQNAYVEAGNYTIPSGVTLLVPYESTGKSYTSPSKTYEKAQNFASATQYVLLTIGSGANIYLAGSIIVMADLCAPNGGGFGSGAPLSAYGRIAMSENSTITVNSGANLYCWGYITGIEGLVTAKSGAKIHEIFQHQNNPGGSAASGWNEDAFFLNQYYVQNIESPLKIEYGASETVYAQMTVPSGSINNLSATLIDKDNTGMFALTSSGSYLIRTYSPSTDRITYDIYGNAKLNYISMSVYGMDLNTSKYVLPITSNMSVKCHPINGASSTFIVQYAVSFIPGAELIVDEGVTLNAQNKLIIYDREEWIDKGFAQFNLHSGGSNWSRSSFTPTRTYTRVKADLVDAKVDLNGTMNVSGSLYTTYSGADIISSNGTGVVKLLAAAPNNSNDIQYSSNKLGTSIKVPMTPAQLHNGDDSYTATVGAVANDQFIYSKTQERWLKNPKTVSWNANGGETEASTLAYSGGDFLGELPAAYKDGYTLAGWYTAADGGTLIDPATKVTANATYYAHWTPKSYTITYRDNGGTAFSGTHVDSPNAHPTTHTFGTATTLNSVNNKTGYTFGGWYRTPSCSGAVVTSIDASECKNITLYAKWSPEEYTITYKDKGNVAFSGVHGYGYPTKHTYGTATALVEPTKAEYVFDGWYTSSDCSTGKVTSLGATDYSADILLYAKWTAAVASVTAGEKTTYYKTLPEAFTAANGKNGNATIKLLKSVDVTSATSSTPLKYNAAYTCTLDLNNCTITGTTGTVSGNPRMVQVDNNSATLIITDNSTDKGGKISMIRTGARGRYYSVQVTKGTLKVAGGTIYADNQTKWTKADDNDQRFAADAIRLESGTSLEVTGGTIEAKSFLSARAIDADAGGATITISNGVLKATATATSSNSSSCTQPNEAVEIYTAGGTITISGGEFSSTVSKTASYNIYATDASQTITVSGGKFKVSGGETTQNVNSATAAANMSISGGYYSHDANLSKYTSAPYQVWSTTAADKTEIGNDYNYKVVEAYTVTFEANGHGKAPASQVIEKGKKATEPTAPTETGYTFGGWYKEAGCTNEWNFASDVVTAATLLYAKWTVNTHKLAWNFDGGTPSGTYTEANNALAYGSTISYPSLSKTGYTFAGWSTNATSMPDADLTITASWTSILYTITWLNWDGSPLKDPTIETTIQYGGRPAYPTASPAPTREVSDGKTYEWDGWTTGAYGAGTFYRIIDNLPVATVDATYYAHFRITAIDVASTSDISIDEDAEVTTTTVRVNGRLAVSSTLTTDDLILEATPSSSGTISGIENITVNSKAYFDYKFDVDPWHWSAFGVPFVIDLDEAAPLKEKETELALGTDYDIIYYNTNKRAEQGPGSHCWEYVDHQAEHKLIPGVQYMIAFNKPKGHVYTVRFTKAETASINYDGDLNLVITGEAAGNNNWNGIANPKMYHALLDAGVTECQVHDGGEIGKDGYYTYDMSDKKFFVGKSAFVQVPSGKKSVVINEATTQDAIQQKLQAPRRAKLTASEGTRYDVQIAPSEEEVADRLLVLTDEDKADEYVIVSDLAKAGVSPVRAQMWVDRYGEKLCKNTTSFINNKADYPIVISTPKAGEYDIFINDQPDDETMLYLTYDGEAIWNLSYGGYVANMEKGTNTHYGLRIVRKPKITTGIEEATILNGDAVRKVIVEDKVFIIRANQVYSIDGRLVK